MLFAVFKFLSSFIEHPTLGDEIETEWGFGWKDFLQLLRVAAFGVVFATTLWFANKFALKRRLLLSFTVVATLGVVGAVLVAFASAPTKEFNPRAQPPQTQEEADAMYGIKRIPPLPAPEGLTVAQLDVWNGITSMPNVKSAEIVKLDPSLVASGSVTLNIKGKKYVIEGKTERKVYTGVVQNQVTGKKEEITGGQTIWHSEANGHTGSLIFDDTGIVSGSFALINVGNFRVFTNAGLTFLVEDDYVAAGAAIRAAQTGAQPNPTAEKARFEAAAAERAADEKALRTYKGERLFEPAEEASLPQQLKEQLAYVRADKATMGVHPVHVNRLAVDAPVTVFVIDEKEYRFVGNVSITRPPPGLAKPITGYWAVTDAWDGHTASGERANVWRHIWGMSGQINVGERRFQFESRGESGFLREVNPTLIAEREAEQKRARENAEREATQHPTVIKAWTPASQAIERPRPVQPAVPPKAQLCAEKTQFLSGLDEADGYLQPAQLRSYILELRAIVKAEMRDLQC